MGLLQTVMFAAMLAGCAAQNPQQAPEVMTVVQPAPWSVNYSDGSGNLTRFWQESGGQGVQFSYDPVQPHESSSGTYSGGEPSKGALTTQQAEELWQHAHALQSNSVLHAASRMKGTGAFDLTTPEGKSSFVIANSAELKAFNTFVQSLVRSK